MLKLMLELFETFKGVPDQPEWQQMLQMFKYAFLAIYSILLVTDGYYFLISLILGFGFGGLYFSSTDIRIVTREYEKSHVELEVNYLLLL